MGKSGIAPFWPEAGVIVFTMLPVRYSPYHGYCDWPR